MAINKEAWKQFEALKHDKKRGFYDKSRDRYFKTLDEWLRVNGYTWKDVSN